MTQVVYQNGLWRTNSYNSRLQMSGFVDDLNNGGTVGSEYDKVSYTWPAKNNGNLQGATWNYGGAGATGFTTFTQGFAYDTVNRLKTASDSGGWSRNYYYDAYGNMAESGSGVGFDLNAPVTASGSVAGLYNGNNQLVVAGMGYDGAGHLSQLSGFNNFSYDGEGRLTGAGRTGGVSESYQYDGEGRRVVKSGGGSQTIYVYDAMGRLAAEYASVLLAAGCVTCYLSADALGSTRLVTDQGGNLVTRHDYLPFGEEIGSGQVGRGAQFDGADFVNQKFTGKERDSESGLDYFGARYYGSALGRFTSPDEFKGGFDNLDGQAAFSAGPIGYADLSDPQTLNKYVYTRNNPLRYIDPDGHDFLDYLSGVANAFISDNALGAGRASGGNDDFRLGQVVGDGVATITGSLEALGGGGETVVTSPAALTGVGALVPAAGAAVAAHGATTAAVAGGHLVAAAGMLAQSAKGPGTVPPGERDPKRSMTAKEKTDKLAEQNGNCAHCDKPIEGENGIAHHDPVRHADGGTEMKIVHSDCHKELHGCGS